MLNESSGVSDSSPVSVMIVEDQEITRAGLRLILQATKVVKIVAEADNGETAVVQP